MKFTSAILAAVTAVGIVSSTPIAQSDPKCIVTEIAYTSLSYNFKIQVHAPGTTVDKKYLNLIPTPPTAWDYKLGQRTPQVVASSSKAHKFGFKDQKLVFKDKTAYEVTPRDRSRWRNVRFQKLVDDEGPKAIPVIGINGCNEQGGTRIELITTTEGSVWCIAEGQLQLKPISDKSGDCQAVVFAVVKE